MNKKQTYQTPRVLKEVGVQLERDFLGGSIVDDTLEIVSAGQEVHEIDAADVNGSEFDWNSTWEWE
jgi:hypothetical protein